MNKYLILLIILALSVIVFVSERHSAGDSYIRDRVVLLKSSRGSCTGVEVRGKSKKHYILTAGHCRALLEDNKVTASHEDGREEIVEFIEEDVNADLMLLTTNDNRSIDIAKHIHKYEHVHTMTHGGGYPSFRTDGEYLIDEMTTVGIYEIIDPSMEAKCIAMPKQVVYTDPIFGEKICVLRTYQTITTAAVIPGSSGGPLLDDKGELIGIVSAEAPSGMNAFVTLMDIQDFLSTK